ncbi:GTPase-associated protein 1-related protein [Streptomyces sp. NPDC001982]|uniref:GTPase-associated protein 1-related protein n=1 Tax=Streptomyces sp. NPDC001982 TaxID=3154405 RepID=UPI00332C4102
MSLAQLHYTSAPPGPDGSGFRFTAVSSGVPATLLREAEQLIGYEPPHDGPVGPAEQLKGFPTALSFSELSDGGRLLSRSVYTGTDHGGRPGNFHAHALHLPSGARLPDGALPITAWESPRWAEATPPEGRPVPIERFEPSGLLRKEGLVVFARSRADRLAPFFADLRALVGRADARQLVVVERDSADVALWIALACTVLPREQAHALTFTTYTRRPRQARQQIIGALPSSEPVGDDHRFRVHDCTARADTEPVTDTWADLWARIWSAGRPDLFRDAPDDLGGLAATALTSGIALRSDARAAAARWTTDRAFALPEERLRELVERLCGDGVGRLDAYGRSADGATADTELVALADLLERLDGNVPTAVSAPLAARVLASGVSGRGPVPVLRAGSLTPQAQTELARDLAYDLRAGIADATEPAAGRPLALLRAADLLDVDCQDELPDFAGRLARGLVGVDETAGNARRAAADPAAPVCPPALLEAVHGHPALRIALFEALNTLAAADPPAATRRLAGSGLPVELPPAFPHLRMCVAGAGTSGDRLGRFHSLLRTAGVSPHAEPAVLRTAFRLVWPDGLPTGREASLLLNQLGSDTHRMAGTRDLLIGAALAAPADDPDVPALATDLLRSFTGELRRAYQAPLHLLEFAGLLGTDREGEEWVSRALALRDGAPEPVPEPVMERVFEALARRLLTAPVPESELYALARSGDRGLLAAYEREARGERVGDRLRVVPSYVAACFCDWSAYPGTHPSWDATRTTLLSKVLRPVVRVLPPADRATVEEALARAGRGKLDAFHAWNRPGALGRLAGRLTGRGR